MFDYCASEARGVRQAALRALIRLVSVYTFKLVRFADALIMPDRRPSPIPSPSQWHSSCTRIKFNYPDIVVPVRVRSDGPLSTGARVRELRNAACQCAGESEG